MDILDLIRAKLFGKESAGSGSDTPRFLKAYKQVNQPPADPEERPPTVTYTFEHVCIDGSGQWIISADVNEMGNSGPWMAFSTWSQSFCFIDYNTPDHGQYYYNADYVQSSFEFNAEHVDPVDYPDYIVALRLPDE